MYMTRSYSVSQCSPDRPLECIQTRANASPPQGSHACQLHSMLLLFSTQIEITH